MFLRLNVLNMMLSVLDVMRCFGCGVWLESCNFVTNGMPYKRGYSEFVCICLLTHSMMELNLKFTKSMP